MYAIALLWKRLLRRPPEGTSWVIFLLGHLASGKGLRLILPVVVVLLIAIALSLLAYSAYVGTIVNVDGLYSAQVARNLLEGKGYRTSEMSQYEVVYFSESGWLDDGPPWNNAGRFPLPIVLKAGFFAVLGGSFFVGTTLFSMVFFVLSGVLIYCLSYYVFRRTPLAFLASLLYLTNPFFLFGAIEQKETTLDSFVFLSLLFLAIWWLRSGKRDLPQLALIGVITGLAYLTRFSMGAFTLVVVLGLILLARVPGSGRPGFLVLLRRLVVYVSCFALTVSPFLFYNTVAFGNPLFSGNLLLQLSAFTQPVKFMNPWWKLEYPFDVRDSLGFLSAYGAEIFGKSFGYGLSTLWDFALIGFPELGYATWWWIPIGYVVWRSRVSRPLPAEWQGNVITLVLLVTSVHLVGALLLLSPLAGSVGYVSYLFSGLALLAALGIERLVKVVISRLSTVTASSRQVPTHIPNRKAARSAKRNVVLTWLVLVGIVASIALPAVIRYAPSPLRSAFPEAVPDWLTEDDLNAMALASELTQPGDIVLSSQPWNIVWWADRPALALPEYPDQVFLLLSAYRLPVKAIYIANLNSVFFRDVGAAYTYDAYRRIAENGMEIQGFRLVYRSNNSLGPNVLFVRDPMVDLESLLQTRVIDFGGSRDSNHLVWGWSRNFVDGSRNATWAVRPGGVTLPLDPRYRYYGGGCPVATAFVDGRCLPHVTYRRNPSYSEDVIRGIDFSFPHAEVSFMVGASRPISLSVTLKTPVANTSIAVTLNANVLSYGQVGELVGIAVIRVPNEWTSISLNLPRESLRDGLNTLTFQFSNGELAEDPVTGVPATFFCAFDRLEFQFG